MSPRLSVYDFFAAMKGPVNSLEDLKLSAKLQEEFVVDLPCDCRTCLRQYRSRNLQKSILFTYYSRVEDPASLAKYYVRSIESDRAFLRQIISESGAVILNRWQAGLGRRRALLKKAQPGLYPKRNPLIDISSRTDKFFEQRRYRQTYMLPYLNVDDLSKDSTNFIGLLLHRTKCLPEEWVPFDNAILRSGWKRSTLSEDFADGCIFMHGDRFGQWSTFDPIAVHRNDACGAPRALLILESQQTLMRFLRDLTTVILIGEKLPNAPMPQVTVSESTDAQYLKISTEWLQFLNTDRPEDQLRLSFRTTLSNQPYSAAPSFDIDTMLDIAESQVNEAQDELWLLQTDLEYFHDRSRYQEATWFDKLVAKSHRQHFSAKDKFHNVGFAMTINAMLHAQDWQGLLDECRNVKRESERSESQIGSGKPLPERYESALGSLGAMLERSQRYHQRNLQRFFMRSPAFSNLFKVTLTGHHQDLGAIFSSDIRDYISLRRRDDCIGWCLYQLTLDFDDPNPDAYEPSAVLRCLNDVLNDCTRKEAERVDPEMHRCLSELTAITHMTKLFDLHRPSFRALGADNFRDARRPYSDLWELECMLSEEAGLGPWISPLNKFRMPTGRKDEKWLARRDAAHSALRALWVKARETYEISLKNMGVPQDIIDSELEWMKQGESAEHVARLNNERSLVMDRLKAVRERTLAKEAAPQQGEIGSFIMQQEAEARFRVPAPSKGKTKTRQVDASEAENPPETEEIAVEERPPVLYTVKPASIEEKAVRLMFPDPNHDAAKEKSSIDWLDFVATLATFGFRAEHRGGSAFTFRGEIMLPDSSSGPQTRSFTVHRPHPDTMMSPIVLQSLGRRCNRRFGWERANFDIEGKRVGQAI